MNQRTKSILRVLGLLIFLALGIKILTPYIKSIPDSINALKGLNYWALALAIAFEFLKFLSSGQLINSISGLFKQRVSIGQATMIVLGSASFGMVGGGSGWIDSCKLSVAAGKACKSASSDDGRNSPDHFQCSIDFNTCVDRNNLFTWG